VSNTIGKFTHGGIVEGRYSDKGIYSLSTSGEIWLNEEQFTELGVLFGKSLKEIKKEWQDKIEYTNE
jgi:hypothetical protein